MRKSEFVLILRIYYTESSFPFLLPPWEIRGYGGKKGIGSWRVHFKVSSYVAYRLERWWFYWPFYKVSEQSVVKYRQPPPTVPIFRMNWQSKDPPPMTINRCLSFLVFVPWLIHWQTQNQNPPTKKMAMPLLLLLLLLQLPLSQSMMAYEAKESGATVSSTVGSMRDGVVKFPVDFPVGPVCWK